MHISTEVSPEGIIVENTSRKHTKIMLTANLEDLNLAEFHFKRMRIQGVV